MVNIYKVDNFVAIIEVYGINLGFINKKCINNIFMYSQTCVQRPPLGPQICGRCWQAVVVQR
jgi:hypothetical protein